MLVLMCGSVMPGHRDEPGHRCERSPHRDSLHDAPLTEDGLSPFFGLSVSWHDPLMEWSD